MGIQNLDSSQVAAGRILGRIISETPEAYHKLGIVNKDTVFIFTRADTMYFVPHDTTRAIVRRRLVVETHAITQHGGQGKWWRAIARWRYVPHDEEAWLSCMQMGCCYSDAFSS